MNAFHSFETATLYPYHGDSFTLEDIDESLSSIVEKIVVGSYVDALKENQCQNALGINTLPAVRPQKSNIFEFYKCKLQQYLQKHGKIGEQVLLCVGISCLQLFTQNNFCGPLIGPSASLLLPGLIPCDSSESETRLEALKELVLDTEGVYNLLSQPEYLIIARIIFFDLRKLLSSCIAVDWWCCRCGIIHQKVSDEQSPIIYETISECLHNIESNKDLISEDSNRDLTVLFHIEAGQCHLHYYNVGKAKYHFEKALSILTMEISLTGALGVRTWWQQHELAQLVVKVTYLDKPITESEPAGPHLLPTDLPQDVALTDDTRLNQVKFAEIDQDIIPDLRPIEQSALFAHFILKRKSQAQDVMLNEETKAYLSALLQYPKNWSVQMSSLFIRSKVEAGETRAMERSLYQLEELVNSVQREEPSRFERLKMIYSSLLLTQWHVQQELARMFTRIGSIKTALEIFERLHLWEDVILCYNELQMRHRSAEIIKTLLEKEPTPKLWCLLGDATDDIECYNKAWELSGQRSGRAQRCLGNYYYIRKDFTKAIEHFQVSVQINSLQFPVWQRLAYCALQSENWEECARAYKRCSVLEPDSFECWNNISQAYIRLGALESAWKSLQEALRCRMDNWRVWDNYMLVSTSLGYMTQALNAYNRILMCKKAKHIDTEILGRIVHAILGEKTDPDGHPMKVLHKKCLELLAKLTNENSSNGELWFLYSEVAYTNPDRTRETKHTAMQNYRKSVATIRSENGWDRDADKVCLVLIRAMRLIEVAKEVCKESDAKAAVSDLSSIRGLLRSLIFEIKAKQVDVNTGELVECVKIPLSEVENEIIEMNALIERYRSL